MISRKASSTTSTFVKGSFLSSIFSSSIWLAARGDILTKFPKNWQSGKLDSRIDDLQ